MLAISFVVALPACGVTEESKELDFAERYESTLYTYVNNPSAGTVRHQMKSRSSFTGTHRGYQIGDKVRLIAQPEPDWSFQEWAGPDIPEGIDKTQATIEVDISSEKAHCVAVFSKKHNVRIHAIGPGKVLDKFGDSISQASRFHGEELRLVAVAEKGKEFHRWVLNGETIGHETELDISVEAGALVEAVFGEPLAWLYYGIGDSGRIFLSRTPDGAIEPQRFGHPHSYMFRNKATYIDRGAQYELGAQVKLTAASFEKDLYFSYWEDAKGNILGNANPLTVTIDGETEVGANFRRIEDRNKYSWIRADMRAIASKGDYAFENVTPKLWPRIFVLDDSGVLDAVEYAFDKSEKRIEVGFKSSSKWRHPTTWITRNGFPPTPENETVNSSSVVVKASPMAFISTRFGHELTVRIVGEGGVRLNDKVLPSSDIVEAHYEHGETVRISPVSSGWKFVEWLGAASGSKEPAEIEMTRDRELVAVFARPHFKDAFQVSLVALGGGHIVVTDEQTLQERKVNWNTQFAVRPTIPNWKVSFEAKSHVGYRFAGWRGDLTGLEEVQSLSVDGPKAVSARFVPVEDEVKPIHHIGVQIQGNGSVWPRSSWNDAATEDYAEIEAIPNFGWRFDHWEYDGSTSSSSNVLRLSTEQDTIVRAVFRPGLSLISLPDKDRGELYVLNSNGVYIKGGPNKFNAGFRSGDSVTVKVEPKRNYRFSHWGHNPSITDSTISLKLREHTYLVPHFIRTHPFTVFSHGPGTFDLYANGEKIVDRGDSYRGRFDEGTYLRVVGHPEPGYEAILPEGMWLSEDSEDAHLAFGDEHNFEITAVERDRGEWHSESGVKLRDVARIAGKHFGLLVLSILLAYLVLRILCVIFPSIR
jgi:hypothetical protein